MTEAYPLPAPLPAEAAILACLARTAGEPAPRRIYSISPGRGQAARLAAQRWPQAAVVCLYLDLYRCHRAAAWTVPANLTLLTGTDFPDAPCDLAILPLPAQGEAELARDLLQNAVQRLPPGGTLLAATDNPRDRWLHAQLARFGRIRAEPAAGGICYRLVRGERPAKRKEFGCRFAFRDGERLLQACSRPGVFAHRRVDGGARQVLRHLEVRPGERVLEIGCGSGVASLAAAARGAEVLAVDSAARAIECLRRSAAANGLENLAAELTSLEEREFSPEFDLALANPPYYAGMRIAERFLGAAESALLPGGRLLAVTRQPDWYAERLPAGFRDVELLPSGGYTVVRARRLD